MGLVRRVWVAWVYLRFVVWIVREESEDLSGLRADLSVCARSLRKSPCEARSNLVDTYIT